MPRRRKNNVYVVWKGRKRGVFDTWEECAAQVVGYPGAEYKAFPTRQEAERAYRQGKYEDFMGKTPAKRPWLFAPDGPIPESYAVDAACAGNPGPMEYRCVHIRSGKEIFHEGPFEYGTNNIGEFLALVHALALLKRRGITAPIYSDSGTAIAWVRAGKCGTNLPRDERTKPLFDLIARAERWLAENEYPNRILKWDSEAWGEIPADFNRK
ncbi:MAG: ribonuclease H [Anaerolineae bacterium]|nr:MAG: ribonuclease H [Anaerolineae bacterium]